MQTTMTYRSRAAGFFLIALGLFMLGLASILPFVLEAPILGFILMGVPMIFTGLIALLHGIAAGFTSIQITEHELKLVVPEWRGFPAPPFHRASLRWDELLAVRRRKEIYGVPIPPFALSMPFAVDVYAIDTARKRFILGGKSLSRLPEAMTEIAGRSGLAVHLEADASAKLVKTLLRGAPAWDAAPPLKRSGPANYSGQSGPQGK